MSDLIRLLPDSVANQIAAGEVIQRPASVIKELVENAVDADARTIHVLVVDAGRTSIQVIDDGKGMSETDARLSFERHATSKIRQADDLFALHTMGFRGEALASIAAVAHVELLTRREEDEIGTRLLMAGSKVVSQEPASCPVGSNFKVENLFFNVPARRKFLKSNATELSNILTAFERIVLVYPDIHFTLHHNGTELLNLKPATLRQRISDVFGKQYSQDLLPVEVHTAMCTVTGFVSKPEGARKKTAHDYFFVNGRFMKHPYFHKAVISAYDRLIPDGSQIPYFLYFEVAPEDIDVNIHPTKTEIKFENEQAIWQILIAAVLHEYDFTFLTACLCPNGVDTELLILLAADSGGRVQILQQEDSLLADSFFLAVVIARDKCYPCTTALRVKHSRCGVARSGIAIEPGIISLCQDFNVGRVAHCYNAIGSLLRVVFVHLYMAVGNIFAFIVQTDNIQGGILHKAVFASVYSQIQRIEMLHQSCS